VKKLLTDLINAAIDNILTRINLEKRLDDLRQDAKAELDELRDKAFAELEETRDKALAMVKESLPEMAAAVSQAAVTSVFDHTQIDETTDRVTDVFTNILDRLPFGFGK
jgi:F0F1-type ATP synthase membrane subunit b/b'